MSSLSGSRGATGNKIPRGYTTGRLQQFGPEQMNLFKRLFSFVSPGSQLAQQAGGEEIGFSPFEEQARRGFQEFTGALGSRFSGMGIGARRGSAFRNLATQGAQDFAMQLAAKRQDLQRQALADLLGISQTLLGQRPTEQFLIKKEQKPSRLGQLLGAGLPILGAGLGAFGGPAGMAIGGTLGSALASGFTGQQPGSFQGISDLPTKWSF